MLSKKICKQCWKDYGSENQIKNFRNEKDERHWKEGKVLCVEELPRNRLRNTENPPSNNCPFFLEHTLVEQEI